MRKHHVTILLYTAGGLLGVAGFFLYDKYFSVRANAVRKAVREWEDWGKQTIDINNRTIVSGGKENDSGYAERVGKYWQDALNKNYDGYDRDIAWSASFISYVWKDAGAGDRFPYSESHSTYIRDSISNRKANMFNKPFVGLKVNEYAPKVGDMVCYSREMQQDLYDLTGAYRSHCDIVVAKGKNFIEVIGGNVGQAVTKKILLTDDKGYLIDNNNNWFAVIKSNL